MAAPAAHAQEEASRALAEALRTSFLILKILLVGLLIAYPFSGIERVEQHEQALVLRLGRYRATLGPGWHLTMPEPIDEIIKVPTARVQTYSNDDFWYALTREEKATGRENPDFPDTLVPGRDGYSLTGDGNLLHSRWELRYRIVDPRTYELEIEDPVAVIGALLDASVTAVSHRFRIDAALYDEAERFRAEVEADFRRRLKENAPVGIEIEGLYVPAMSPPRQVREAFDAVLQAEQTRSEEVNKAESYAVGLRSDSAAEAARIVAEAKARAAAEKARAAAEADRFLKILSQVRKQRAVVVPAIYLATLQRVLTRVDRYLLESHPGETPEIRILLNPEPRKRKSGGESNRDGGQP